MEIEAICTPISACRHGWARHEALPKQTFDDIAHLPGSEPGPRYGLTPVESERLTNRAPLSDAQAAKLIERSRKNLENSNRRR